MFNLYAEHITRNARLNELQATIKIGKRNINNLSYVDEYHSNGRKQEALKSFLMRVKEERERTGLKLNIKKTKIMVSGPITSLQIEGKR